MGQKPVFIGGVSVKTKTDLIEYATKPHGFKGMLHHGECLVVACHFPVPQQKIYSMWCREFGGFAESTINRIVSIRQFAESIVKNLLIKIIALA